MRGIPERTGKQNGWARNETAREKTREQKKRDAADAAGERAADFHVFADETVFPPVFSRCGKDRRSFPPDEKTSSSVLRSNYAVQLNSAGNTAGMRLADRNASAFFLRTDGPAGKGLSSIRTAEHVNQLNIQTT